MSGNFRLFLVHGISYRPMTYPYLKKISVLKIFIFFMKFFLMVAMNLHFYYYDCYKL